MALNAAAHAAPKIAIIIDDVGYRLNEDRRVLALPTLVAVAVLPHSPHGARIAEMAHDQQRPILVHLPMQALDNQSNAAFLGDGTLGLDTTRNALRTIVSRDLAAVPHARGVNNHMGSLLTQHPGHMRWLMAELKCQRMTYFIDSYTTPNSVAMLAAVEQGMPTARRHVFLDTDENEEEVRRQFKRLIAMAKADGQAIAIGHPLPTTMRVLKSMLPTLADEGIVLVPPEALTGLELGQPVTYANDAAW